MRGGSCASLVGRFLVVTVGPVKPRAEGPPSPTPTENRSEHPAGPHGGTCGSTSEKSDAAALDAGEMRDESGDAAAESRAAAGASAAQVGREEGGLFPGLCPQQT